MSESNWTFMLSSLDAATVDRGVTGGIPRPPGGGNFVFGFNSLVVAAGTVAMFANQTGFAPTASGASIRGALRRHSSGGSTGWSHFLFVGMSTNDVTSANGYMLGLQDDNPSRIALRKGTIIGGIPAGTPDPPVNGILLRSSGTVEIDKWVHLRLDMVVNGTGDVLLNVFSNDLDAAGASVASPAWVVIPGMTTVANPNGFFDDTLGVNSGSVPFTSGRVGKGYRCSDVSRRAFFDHIEVLRQV